MAVVKVEASIAVYRAGSRGKLNLQRVLKLRTRA